MGKHGSWSIRRPFTKLSSIESLTYSLNTTVNWDAPAFDGAFERIPELTAFALMCQFRGEGKEVDTIKKLLKDSVLSRYKAYPLALQFLDQPDCFLDFVYNNRETIIPLFQKFSDEEDFRTNVVYGMPHRLLHPHREKQAKAALELTEIVESKYKSLTVPRTTTLLRTLCTKNGPSPELLRFAYWQMTSYASHYIPVHQAGRSVRDEIEFTKAGDFSQATVASLMHASVSIQTAQPVENVKERYAGKMALLHYAGLQDHPELLDLVDAAARMSHKDPLATVGTAITPHVPLMLSLDSHSRELATRLLSEEEPGSMDVRDVLMSVK